MRPPRVAGRAGGRLGGFVYPALPPELVFAPGAVAVSLDQELPAPPAQVFACWLDESILPRWCTGPEGARMVGCHSDAVPGGEWREVVEYPDGAQYVLYGVYHVVKPPLGGGGDLVYTEDQEGRGISTVHRVLFLPVEGQPATRVMDVTWYRSSADAACVSQAEVNQEMIVNFERLAALLRASSPA